MSLYSINNYYNELEKTIHFGGSRKETAIRSPFYNLLNDYARSKDLMLVAEISTKNKQGKIITPDGTIKDSIRNDWGYWESKDESDDINEEIRRKFSKGYPGDNILFEDSQTAVLYQHGDEVMRVNMREDEKLHSVLTRFLQYERPEVYDFREAIEKFKEDIPKVTAAIRDIIEAQEKSNLALQKAKTTFLELCKASINPSITSDDVKEMMIQHILSADIFNTIFDEPHFHQENNIARELNKVIETFFTGAVRKQTLGSIKHYYDTINARAASIADHHEKQKFLKVVYENFYKGYNPKAADRLGIVYTPNEIVQFMIRSTDYLLHKHFGKTLGDKNVEILDPATGTGTFICDIIDYLPLSKLAHKYKNELHANEVAILPYYIANLNIEYTYKQKTGQYAEFDNLCFVDTLDNTGFHWAGKQGDLFGVSAENAQRIRRQNERKISVIIGNPPYNAKQENYNYQNANRFYVEMDKRIKETYVKEGSAQNQIVLYDMYVRFFRWATDRLNNEGIIAFVSNNSFIDGKTFDGFRKLAAQISEIYIINLKGNARTSGERRRQEGGNVFTDDIRVGIAVYFFVKRESTERCRIFYNEIGDYVKSDEKKAYLVNHSLERIQFENITPDKNHNWINQSENEWGELLPLIDKEAKAGKSEKAIFKLFSRGIATQRDEWVYDFSKDDLKKKVEYFIDIYQKTISNKQFEDIGKIKWDRELSKYLERKIEKNCEEEKIVSALYRPYFKQLFYFDRHFNGMTYQWFDMYRNNQSNNYIIIPGLSSPKDFFLLNSDTIIDLNCLPAGCQCLPLYRYNKEGNRIDNITDWGLQQFQNYYTSLRGGTTKQSDNNTNEPSSPVCYATSDEIREEYKISSPNVRGITKQDIFHYVYAVLHNPAYRKKYELNLKREFPRIPFYDNF